MDHYHSIPHLHPSSHPHTYTQSFMKNVIAHLIFVVDSDSEPKWSGAEGFVGDETILKGGLSLGLHNSVQRHCCELSTESTPSTVSWPSISHAGVQQGGNRHMLTQDRQCSTSSRPVWLPNSDHREGDRLRDRDSEKKRELCWE